MTTGNVPDLNYLLEEPESAPVLGLSNSLGKALEMWDDPRAVHIYLERGATGDGYPTHTGPPGGKMNPNETHDNGMKARREVLGDEYVDAAVEKTTPFTADFQDFITRYAWGEVWTRPGLDRRTRSVVTLTALMARGHHEELATHVDGALRNGLTEDEIKEVLLQGAIYCGVPAANAAFAVARRVLAEREESRGTEKR